MELEVELSGGVCVWHVWASKDDEDEGKKGERGEKAARRKVQEMQILNRLPVTIICIGFT